MLAEVGSDKLLPAWLLEKAISLKEMFVLSSLSLVFKHQMKYFGCDWHPAT